MKKARVASMYFFEIKYIDWKLLPFHVGTCEDQVHRQDIS